MLLSPINIHRDQICDIRHEVSNAKQPQFDSMALNLARRHDSSAEGHQHSEHAPECVPRHVEQDADEQEREEDRAMCVSHVVVDQEEDGLNGLLDQYH